MFYFLIILFCDIKIFIIFFSDSSYELSYRNHVNKYSKPGQGCGRGGTFYWSPYGPIIHIWRYNVFSH